MRFDETAIGIALIAGLAVLLVVGGIVWAVRRGRVGRIESPEEAAAAADEALGGFETLGAVVGADGAGALAVDRAGRVAVMRRYGKRITVCEIAWLALRSTVEGIEIDSGDRRMGRVLIAGVDALDVRRLAPADLKRMIG
ncbi:hypothetical protein [uncultured Sphingomonas sp.]|uniref:hypothetical protein n=1 Tax=uncultured Sphingomonas sp. TaxID=158754 RepID=UPI0025F6E3F6|nr:hypothetical protein [uncultured Sphingomonas sp.]